MGRTVALPSGAPLHGRRLSDPPTEGARFLLALAKGPLPAWEHRRVDWPDFRLPRDEADALDALSDALRRAREGQIVEIGCTGGRGRTGTAIAAIAVMDGMPAEDAVAWVRREYDARAVETPWQARWVRRLPGKLAS